MDSTVKSTYCRSWEFKLSQHLLYFIRDSVRFCLGSSLILYNIFSSLVPYSSLIFQVNLDRLSLII